MLTPPLPPTPPPPTAPVSYRSFTGVFRPDPCLDGALEGLLDMLLPCPRSPLRLSASVSPRLRFLLGPPDTVTRKGGPEQQRQMPGFRQLGLLLVCLLSVAWGQYGGRGGVAQNPRGGYQDEDDITDRAVEYYMMQQQAQQKQYQEDMHSRHQEEEMIRRQQEAYLHQQAQAQDYNRRQQQAAVAQQQAMRQAQEEILEAQRLAEYEAEMEEEYYRQQQQYAQQVAYQQQQQQHAQQQTRDQREPHQIQFEQEQAAKRRRAQGAATTGATLDDATTLAEQGTLLMQKGNYADALVVYDRCLSIQLGHLGDMHPMVSHTVDLMGVALLRIGSATEAQEAFTKALQIQEHIHGAGNHPDWALTVMHLGQSFELEAENLVRDEKGWERQMEDLTERAYDYYEKALAVFVSRVEEGEPDLDIANIYHCMGNVHNIRSEWMEALRRFKTALSFKVKILGEDDPSVAWTKNNIGNSFKGMFKIDDAVKWYSEALETVTTFFGPDHPEVAHVHWNLALAYHTKGEIDAQKRRLTWHSRWPFRWFTQITKKRLAHEGVDFDKMDTHLNHAFNVFVQRLGEDHISTQRATHAVMALRELTRD